MTEGFEFAFNLLEAIQEKDVIGPEESAVNLPRSISDWVGGTRKHIMPFRQFFRLQPLISLTMSPCFMRFLTTSISTGSFHHLKHFELRSDYHNSRFSLHSITTQEVCLN